VACLLMAGSAFADMKVGVFNSQAVAMDSDAAKAAQQKLQSQFGAERSQLEKQAKDLQTKGEALQTQVAKMNAKEREEKQMEFLRLRRAFEEKSRNFARKVENTENQIRQNMAQQIYQAAQTIAQKQKLDLILDAASGSVMYATPQLDITKAVLAEAGATPADVTKVTVFIVDMADFQAVNAVYAETFGSEPPARSCVAVKDLPKGVLCEVEVIAEL